MLPNRNNNELHTAILEGDTEKALALVKNISKAKLNEPSLKNTPLMLALKVGNFEVAEEIVRRNLKENTYVRMTIKDGHGLQPLHLACALRCNSIIKLLIEAYKKYMDLNDNNQEADECCKAYLHDNDFSQLGLQDNQYGFPGYQNTRYLASTAKPLTDRTLLDIYQTPIQPRNARLAVQYYSTGITDNPMLCFSPAPELTDIILFHLEPHCTAQGIATEKPFITDQQSPSSNMRYYRNAAIGIDAFIAHREAKPLDPTILYYLDESITKKPETRAAEQTTNPTGGAAGEKEKPKEGSANNPPKLV